MGLVSGLLDRLVLLGCTVAGGCVPGFLAQYRQRVGGRLDQVTQDLEPFREIARRLHGGSLDGLIRHHLASSDATFHAEGDALQAMVDAEQSLSALWSALQGSVWAQLRALASYPDRGLVDATWASYVPSFTLDADGVALALVVGLAGWLIYLAVAAVIGALFGRNRASRARRPSTSR